MVRKLALFIFSVIIITKYTFIFSGTKPWSIRMAESTMKNFWQGGKRGWNYEIGTVLNAYKELYKRTEDYRFLKFIMDTVDACILPNGLVKYYNPLEYNIDQINEGRMLLFLYRITGKEKYKRAAQLLRFQLATHPRTASGGFWHKKIYPYQMWLDGLYMESPFYIEYTVLFEDPEGLDDVVKQLVIMEQQARDPKSGLLYHGWDESRQQSWADPYSGVSPEFWGRAVGWYAMALVDVLDWLPEDHIGYNRVVAILNRLAEAISKVQDPKTGLWWQILDKGGSKDNYLESSASAMFVYSLLKGVRKGWLSKEYLKVAKRGYNGIIDNFISENPDGTINLEKTCAGAGLGYGRDGTYNYYIYQTKVRKNDGKAIGPFILASIEMELLVKAPYRIKAVYDSTIGSVRISWKEDIRKESQFLIERSENYRDFEKIGSVDKNITHFIDRNIQMQKGKTYFYRVKAVYKDGSYSYNSDWVEVHIPDNSAKRKEDVADCGLWIFDCDNGVVIEDRGYFKNNAVAFNIDDDSWITDTTGKYLYLDGKDDYVVIPGYQKYKFEDSDFKIEVVFKPESDGVVFERSKKCIIGNSPSLRLYIKNSKLYLYIKGENGLLDRKLFEIKTKDWLNVKIIRRKGSKSFEVLVDDKLAFKTKDNIGQIPMIGNFTLGNSADGRLPLKGGIKLFQISNDETSNCQYMLN